ncbi:hypothetical protein PWT90_09560 [Aphanocladium album]|nr:hypothetical protein PWT90_09560 [Aphanocladium album]
MFSVTEKGQTLFIVQLVCLYIVWAVTALRMLALLRRRADSGGYLREDAFMDLAVLLYTVLAVVVLHGVAGGGIGKHVDKITAAEAAIAFRAWFICELLYGPLTAVVRTSILLVLLRLCRSKLDKMILYICLGTNYVFAIAYIFLNLFQCSPPSFFWRQFEDVNLKGSCAHPNMVPNAAIAHSAISAPSDLVTALMVLKLMRHTMLDWRTKVSVMIFLSLGLLDVAIWSVIEPCVGILAGSLPFVRVLFKRRTKKLGIRAERRFELVELPVSGGIQVSTTWECKSGTQPTLGGFCGLPLTTGQVPCLIDALGDVGCQLDDIACSCKPEHQSAIKANASLCLLGHCSAQDALNAKEKAEAVCVMASGAIARNPVTFYHQPGVIITGLAFAVEMSRVYLAFDQVHS